MSGVTALADAISDMGALTSLDVSSNKVGSLSSQGGWVKEPGKKYRSPTGKYQKEKPAGEDFKAETLIALANAIRDNGALLVLSLKDNNLGTKEAGEVLGEMLKGNSVLKELDLSKNSV